MGVLKVLERIPANASVLDLGCGNGKVALHLAQNEFKGSYLGADFSLGLLEWAEADISAGFQAKFLELDLTAPSWEDVLPSTRFDVILCFATYHHIPSQAYRVSLIKNIRKYLNDDGLFYLSTWQFNRSERLTKKVLPWDIVNISKEEVEEGDYLLDWQRGGSGIRYVHLYDDKELKELAAASGFKVIESFDSDGEGGNLGLYQVWEPV